LVFVPYPIYQTNTEKIGRKYGADTEKPRWFREFSKNIHVVIEEYSGN
jgi:hypothetical protein